LFFLIFENRWRHQAGEVGFTSHSVSNEEGQSWRRRKYRCVHVARPPRPAEKSARKALQDGRAYCEPSSVPQGSRFGNLTKVRHGAIGEVRGQPAESNISLARRLLFLCCLYGMSLIGYWPSVPRSIRVSVTTGGAKVPGLCEVCCGRARFLIPIKRIGKGGDGEQSVAHFCATECQVLGMEAREREGWQRHYEPPVVAPL